MSMRRLALFAMTGFAALSLTVTTAACEKKGGEEAPEGAEGAPEGAEAAPEGAEAAPEGAKGAPEGAEAAPEGAEAAPEGAKVAPEGAEAAPEGAEKAAEAPTGDPEDERLAGTWELDRDAMKEMPQYKDAPDERKKQMDAMMEQMEMEMTFGSETIQMHAKMGGQVKDDKVSYTIKEKTDDTLVIKTKPLEGKEGQEEELTLSFQGDKLIFQQGPQKMTFKKKAE
ncbi:MAG: hypothetical protein ACQEXJ_10955 [Myxococcota bacterium]